MQRTARTGRAGKAPGVRIFSCDQERIHRQNALFFLGVICRKQGTWRICPFSCPETFLPDFLFFQQRRARKQERHRQKQLRKSRETGSASTLRRQALVRARSHVAGVRGILQDAWKRIKSVCCGSSGKEGNFETFF